MSRNACFSLFAQPYRHSLGSAHFGDERDHAADTKHLKHDARVPAIGQRAHDPFYDVGKALYERHRDAWIDDVYEKRSAKNADKQRQNDVFGDKRQNYRHHGRYERPKAENFGIFFRYFGIYG